MKATLALLAALAFGSFFLIPQAGAAPQQLACVGNCNGGAHASAARRHRATGVDATYRRLRHHWGP
jgi:hypothetical protein